MGRGTKSGTNFRWRTRGVHECRDRNHRDRCDIVARLRFRQLARVHWMPTFSQAFFTEGRLGATLIVAMLIVQRAGGTGTTKMRTTSTP